MVKNISQKRLSILERKVALLQKGTFEKYFNSLHPISRFLLMRFILKKEKNG